MPRVLVVVVHFWVSKMLIAIRNAVRDKRRSRVARIRSTKLRQLMASRTCCMLLFLCVSVCLCSSRILSIETNRYSRQNCCDAGVAAAALAVVALAIVVGPRL